jgi:hypothetical protein
VTKAKRKQKLKVYRTPIGFHDAYVAAPSQKAALEAWGADTNLFGRDIAEQVTDPELTRMPLENPGQVVKVLRGTKAEQLAALEKQKPPKRTAQQKAEIVPKKKKSRGRKPSRSAVDRAEEALETLEGRQAKQTAEIERQQQALERKRRELLRRHERERDKAQENLEDERAKHERAVRRYESG